MAKLASTFITDVKRRGYIPDNQEAFKDADILAYVNQELQETIWPEMINLGENFFVISQFLDIKDSNGNKNFPANIVPIPSRAFARALREIKLVDKTALSQGKYEKTNIPWFPLEDEDLYGDSTNNDFWRGNGSRFGYFIVNDGIRFLGDLRDQDETLELRFFVAPPTVESSSTLNGDVNAIGYTAGTSSLELDGMAGTDLDTYCGDGETKLFDIYRKSSGSPILTDVTLTRTDGTDSVFTTTELSTGDLVQLAGFQTGGFTDAGNTVAAQYTKDLMIVPAERSNYIPLPQSMINILEIAVVMRYYESQGDTEAYQVAERRFNKQWKQLAKIYDNRNTGENKKISNRRGLIASRRGWRYDS